MNDIAKLSGDLNYLDLLATVRLDRFHSGSSSIRTGPFLIRYSTFLNHLQRIANQCGLQLSSGPCSGGGNTAGSLVWRLTSECFAVIVAATNNSIPGSDSTYNNLPKLTDLISFAAVYFEFNHDKAVPCPELATDLSMGKYSSLLQHVDNLLTIYAVPGDKIDRARTYLCLQALEKDLSMLTQAMRTDLENNTDTINTFRRAPNQKHDVFSMRDLVNHSLVGHFVGRTGGRLARLTYLVTSAQAMIGNATGVLKNNLQMNSKGVCSTTIGCGSRDGLIGGYMARIGLCPRLSYVEDTSTACQSAVQRLPFMPLVTLQKDAYGMSVPHFAQPDEIKCISIEAEFVLHLDPPLPISTDAVQQLERITGLSNTEIADHKEKDIVLLILQQHKQEHLYGINTHLQNPNLTQHCYRIQSDVKGYLVSCVPFTCSDQIGEIISILRKQASALAFYETFIVHPDKPVEKDTAMTFTFNIKIMAGQMVSLEFDDPKHFGAEIHASLHVRPFDVQCVEFNHSSYLLSHLNEEEKLVTSKKLKTEAKNNLEANFSRILTKTHTLPIGLAWLLTQLRCPIHKQLENIKLPVNNRYKTQENSSSVSQKQLSSLKAMLNRVKSSIIIRGANGTGGVLCGGDRKASLDFESSSSFAAAQVFALNTPSYLNGSKKIPPLPPGVMATPPPAFSHLDTNSVDLSMMSSLRPMSSQSKFRDIPSNLGLSVISTNPSRGLRLDDLLADSAFQSQQHDQQRNPPSVSLSHPLPSYVSPIPGTHTATTFSDVKDAYSEIISPNTSVSNNSSTNMHSSSQKCSTSILSAPNNFTPSSYNIPSISVTSNSVTSGSLAVTKSKSFTASPMIDSSRAPPTSGSMLVNLLNEESLSSSVPLMSPSSLSDRNLYASTHSLINLQNTSLPSASSIANTPSSRLPGVMSNNLQTTSSDTQFSQGYGKSLSSSAPNLTANTSQCLPVCHSNSITSSAGRPKHSNIKHNQTSLNVGPTGNPKKPRKRRRGTIESGFHCVGNQKVNAPIPCVYTNYPTSKHQRVDAVSSNTTNSLPPTYQRASFNQVNPNLVSCSMPYVQQSVIPPTMQNINMPIPNPSKSVYDFDDTPGSMFDVPVGNISSSNSLSFSSGSSLTSPKSCVPANPLQSSGLTASNPNPVANYPTTTSITSSSNLERTIERKTSLKMTIKTVPSQPITSTPKAGVNFSQNEVDKYNRIQSGQSNSTPTSAIDSGRTTHPTHSLVSTKKRKKRSVEGKPSAYMLQMLQLANSSSVSGSDTSITTTSAVINASEPPTQLTTPFALNNPSLKHVKGANKLVGHGSVLVKKERKRRLGHGFTEKTHFSLIPNSSTFNQLHETSENPSVPKPIKINRLSKPLNADTPKDNQIGPGISTGLYTNPISVSPNSVSSKKKFSTASSTPLVPFIGSGSGSDDMLVAKRLFPSTTSLVNSEKRKRNADALKQSSVSQPNCISSTTSNDAAFTSSPQFIPSNPDSSSNANLSRKTPRSSLHSVTNSSRLPHTSTNRLQSSQQTNTSNYLSNNSACITTNIVSNSTPINVVGASSGLIKGYKIPKKKSMSAECLPNMSLSDVNSDKSSGILSSTIQQIQETLSTFRDTLDSQSPEKSNESSLTIVENLFSSSSDPNIECADRVSVTIYNENINDPENNNSDGSSITSDSLSNFLPNNADSCLQSVSHTVSSQSNISASMQIAQSSQQQLPRKSVKSISDIVDKLRAKSTTSISSVINSANINGSSEIGNSEVTTVTASEVQDSVLSSNLTDHACCIRSIPRKDDESQDQWRDNIFEKFCPSGAPTPHQVENGQNGMCKLDSDVDLVISNNVIEESVSIEGDKEPSLVDTSERSLPPSKASTPGLPSNFHSASDSDAKQDTERFEVIKANTDTPASPTESVATVSTSNPNISSKIIPISPTSGKYISSTGSLPVPNMKPNVIRHNSARFEKKAGAGRFSRLGGNGMTLHGGLMQRSNSDSYNHASAGHGHPNRLLRGGLNNPGQWHKNRHHSKAPNFKPPSNWGPVNMDYNNIGVSSSSSSSSAPVLNDVSSGNMGHWMMNSGGNINQGNPNVMLYNNPHSMPHHPYHSTANRAMRPNFGIGGNSGHNLYNTGMMRGNKK